MRMDWKKSAPQQLIIASIIFNIVVDKSDSLSYTIKAD